MDMMQWRAHIDQVVGDEGQWVGILDEDGWPILDLPAVVSITAEETRLTPGSAEVVVSVANGAGRRVLDELVADGLGAIDAEKRLVPASGPTRILCLVRPGERRVFTVTHAVVAGGLAPSTLTIHGVDLLDSLAWWPCPSVPLEWTNARFSTWTTDASGATYAWPRRLAPVEFATTADGYTVRGPARDTLRRLVQDSFDAVNMLMGWQDPHAVVDFAGGTDTSPEVILRVPDEPVLDTIADTARIAGISIDVDLWWPGDPPATIRTPDRKSTVATTWPHPMQIVRITAPGEES